MAVGGLVALTTLVAVSLLTYVALRDHLSSWRTWPMMLAMVGGSAGLCVVLALTMWSGLGDRVWSHLAFSANFLLSNAVQIAVAFILLGILSTIARRSLGTRSSSAADTSLLWVATFVLAAVYTSSNPYHGVNWLALGIPVVAWGLSRRAAWLAGMVAMGLGLMIRRLTFYDAQTPIPMPERWVLGLAVTAAGIAYLWWRERGSLGRVRRIGLGVLCLLPSIAAMGLPCELVGRAGLLVVCLAPVAVLCTKQGCAWDLWLALWATLYCLGTSSNLGINSPQVAEGPSGFVGQPARLPYQPQNVG